MEILTLNSVIILKLKAFSLLVGTNYRMKVFAILCLFVIIQFASALPFDIPSEDDVLDTLSDCGVSWDEDSFSCAHEFISGQLGMRMFDIDWGMVLDNFGQCGFTTDDLDQTLACLQPFVPDMNM